MRAHLLDRMRRGGRRFAALPCALAAALGPCAASASLAAQQEKIQHVVFIIQENRSFNYLFVGFPGAFTQGYGLGKSGRRITLHEQSLASAWDIDHSSNAFFAAYDGGKLDGWNDEKACCGQIPADFAYAYAPRASVKPYWQMAKQYVLADNMFASNLDGSFVAHQYAIAAFASKAVDYPDSAYWGCSAPPGTTVGTLRRDRSYGKRIDACFDNTTLGDEADAANVTWRSYAGSPAGDGGLWSGYQVIDHIYNGPDWTRNVISPPKQFLSDIANGELAQITWITPTFGDSDHAGTGPNDGPAWVTSLVNAIGESPFWSSSAIFLIWDDWGGWFDPAAPPYTDYDGFGFRIPMVVISPYAKKSYVSHVQYETSSVLRFMEDTFGLAPLAASDTRALDPGSDAFDFSKPPRAFKPIGGGKALDYWLRRPTPARAPRRVRDEFGD